MIVENRERITAALSDREVTFEIHLPKVVGSLMFEADKGLMLSRFRWVEQLMTSQNSGNSTGTRYLLLAQVAQSLVQLATTPGRVLATQAEHCVFYGWRRFHRRGMWSP